MKLTSQDYKSLSIQALKSLDGLAAIEFYYLSLPSAEPYDQSLPFLNQWIAHYYNPTTPKPEVMKEDIKTALDILEGQSATLDDAFLLRLIDNYIMTSLTPANIKIQTLIGYAEFPVRGIGMPDVLAVARAWLKHFGMKMGGGSMADVSVHYMDFPPNSWKYCGAVSNPFGDKVDTY